MLSAETIARYLLILCAVTACSDRAAEAAAPEGGFEISLHGRACLEPCRSFALTLDATGRVHVHNPLGEPRLATFDTQVPEQSARDLYRALQDADFVQLLDRYSEPGACDAGVEQRSDSVISLSASGEYKQVAYTRGCRGVSPELDKLLAIEEQLRELTALEQLLSTTAAADCELDGEPISFAPVYTVRNPDATGLGLLRFTNTASERRFIVQGCSGHELTRGTVIATPDCRAELQVDADAPKRWPGSHDERASLFIAGNGLHALSKAVSFLSILVQPGDLVAAQVALLGASCEGGSNPL